MRPVARLWGVVGRRKQAAGRGSVPGAGGRRVMRTKPRHAIGSLCSSASRASSRLTARHDLFRPPRPLSALAWEPVEGQRFHRRPHPDPGEVHGRLRNAGTGAGRPPHHPTSRHQPLVMISLRCRDVASIRLLQTPGISGQADCCRGLNWLGYLGGDAGIGVSGCADDAAGFPPPRGEGSAA